MFIVFCSEVSSMGKKFEDNPHGIEDMGKYIAECIRKNPNAKVEIMRW